MGLNIRAYILYLSTTYLTGLRYKFQSSGGVYEDKTAILTDSDSVWTDVRHLHMREAIDKLMQDFNKFLEENAVFKGYVNRKMQMDLLDASCREGAATLNDMKEMLANLPQYQTQREKVRVTYPPISMKHSSFAQFSLHLSMAQDCMAIFERDKLPTIANVEQVRI